MAKLYGFSQLLNPEVIAIREGSQRHARKPSETKRISLIRNVPKGVGFLIRKINDNNDSKDSMTDDHYKIIKMVMMAMIMIPIIKISKG